MENNMSIVFDAKSQNEGLARMVVAAFLTELDPTIEELNDIKSNGKYKVKTRINCSATDVQNIDKQKLLEAGAAKVEIVTEKTVAKSIEAHSLDRKFDKTGIKQEYESFCSEKVIDSSMGLQYLDKIH